jgi:hypothetical protein
VSKKWPHETIRELLARAECEGSAKALTDTYREAELLRFAIYTFRRQTQIGLGLTVTIDKEYEDGKERFVVHIAEKVLPEVTIVQ